MGVRGKGDYEHEVLIWSRPRWRFAYFAAMGKVGRRPHCARRRVLERNRRASGSSWRGDGGEIPPAENGRIRTLPPHPPQCAHWGTFPPGGRLSGVPVCRPYGGREDFRAVRTPPLRRKRRLWSVSVGHSGVPKWAGFPTPPVGCAPLAHKFRKTGHPGPPGGAGSGWPLKKR